LDKAVTFIDDGPILSLRSGQWASRPRSGVDEMIAQWRRLLGDDDNADDFRDDREPVSKLLRGRGSHDG
jgi:hypothetical protein